MAETFARSHAASRLSELLAESQPWSLRDRLILVRSLAERVRTLHEQGRTHRAVRAESVTVDDRLRPRLDPPAMPQRLGGEGADPEQCPPELLIGEPVLLPESIEAARGVVAKAGHSLDPRRVDIYQIGTLLCRLLTGETMLAYMYDPTIKAKVPAAARGVLRRALGEHPDGPYVSCDELIEALDAAVRQVEPPSPAVAERDTPAEGSVLLPSSDTPPEGRKPAAPSGPPDSAAEPTVERLAHYRVLGRIGSGGMGDVYRGYDESLERDVAIKVLPPELARDTDFVKRFHQEATAAAKIRHPNIVPIYFCGEDAGHHFFAMQHIDGESLAQRLARQRHLSLEAAVAVLEQCLAGLQAAHENGLIHRDIKPGNVLLERTTDRAVVVDFGLVRRMGSQERMTATGMVMGTVDYIAPEQARGHEVDARADVYSLGVLFYQLLSGRLPFKADTPTAMIFQHAYEEPFPLTQAVAGLPAAIYQIVDRMMAKDPAKRYAACADVLADIEAFREGRPLAVRGNEEDSTPATPSGRASDDFDDEAEKPTSEFSAAEIDLPSDLDELADHSPLRRVRDFAATMFRRHAPEFVQKLQSTTQQVDGAVAHYERRRNRLAKLLDEARHIEADLRQQKSANEAAADQALSATAADQSETAIAKMRECDEQIAAVQTQLDQQREQVEDLEAQLAKADATLARLRSQRDALNARLSCARTEPSSVDDLVRQRRKRLRIAAAALAVAGVLALVVILLLLPALIPTFDSPGGDLAENVVAPASIPADAVSFGGHWYRVFSGEMPWDDAQAACEAMGGYLACFQTPEERDFLVTLKGAAKVQEGGKAVWIGGHRDADGNWKWVTGEDFPPELEVDQPAGYLSLAPQGQIETRPPNGFAMRLGRYRIQGYICEWESADKSAPGLPNVSDSESLPLEYQLEEYAWNSGDPLQLPLIPITDGFCLLNEFGGEFEGPGTRTVLTTWQDGHWYLGGFASRTSPAVKATSFTGFMPQVFRPEVSEYRWNHPELPVRMLHKSEGVCFLSGFSGPLEGNGENVRVALHDDGYWYLSGASAKPEMLARATGLRFIEGRTFAADVTSYSWHAGDLPVKMIHRTQGICGLTAIGGAFEGPAEHVRVFVGEDDYWYLSGKSQQKTLFAEAIAVRFVETGEESSTDTSPPTAVSRQWPLAPPGGDIAAGEWVDLLDWIDVNCDINRGQWTRDDDGLTASWSQKGAEAFLPVILGHNYELELDVTLVEGEGVVVVLPAGRNTFNVFLGNPRQGIQWVNGRFLPPSGTNVVRLTPGKRVKALYSVRVQADTARIDVTVDGRPMVSWSGSESSLEGWLLPIPRRPKLGVWSATAKFHSLRVRDLDGETKWIERTPID